MRFHARGLIVQAVRRQSLARAQTGSATAVAGRPEARPRFGFVVTKKSGGAVQRNRIRRRLKEALRLINPLPARPGYDYVILARPEALGMAFRSLQAELLRALKKAASPELSPIRNDHSCRAAEGLGKARRVSSPGRIPKG